MKAYLELAKPRITVMVAATAALGFWLAGGRDGRLMTWTILGTALASAGSAALNQLLEREEDGRMNRTKGRPLPSGRLSPDQALRFASAAGGLGITILVLNVNPLSALLAALAIASYAGVYTPLKRVTPQSTWVGAVSGAMPPLIGWAAARGTLHAGAWVLFAIQFLWQIPHFLALFWLYREDYAKAGFKMMPVVDPEGRATAIQIALHSFGLLVVTVLPALMGLSGLRYGFLALILAGGFLFLGLKASWTMAVKDQRRLFLGSLVYLPAVFLLLLWTR